MKFEDLTEFKINGSIDKQWKTNLAVERILIASGKKVGGITSFLTGLEFIGSILTVFLSLAIIIVLVIIHSALFLTRLVRYIQSKRNKKNLK